MAEEEGMHRRKQEDTAINANVEAMRREYRERRWGQCFAFFLSLSFLGVGGYLGINGHEWSGSFLGLMGISSIVAHFLKSKSGPTPTTPTHTFPHRHAMTPLPGFSIRGVGGTGDLKGWQELLEQRLQFAVGVLEGFGEDARFADDGDEV
jgi:hypothetical protein